MQSLRYRLLKSVFLLLQMIVLDNRATELGAVFLLAPSVFYSVVKQADCHHPSYQPHVIAAITDR